MPTCSQYAIEAFETRGAFVGLVLSIYRILRCNPLCKGGYDPVPEKKSKTNAQTKPAVPTDGGGAEKAE